MYPFDGTKGLVLLVKCEGHLIGGTETERCSFLSVCQYVYHFGDKIYLEFDDFTLALNLIVLTFHSFAIGVVSSTN